jgi:hypothetical protein
MTPLKLLGFQKSSAISPHFGSIYAIFMTNRRLFDVIFSNFAPFVLMENGVPTFLQWSHNILKGEMSLVGPRPMMTDQVIHYGENIDAYNSVRPGISGLWQVSGRSGTTFKERPRFDLYYVYNWSVWLDLYILARTIWVVLSRDRAY